MTILYLYSELMGYNVPVLKELVETYDATINVISWDEKKLTPIVIPSINGVSFHKRSQFNEQSILQFALKLNPDLVYVPNWYDKGYLLTCKEMRKKGVPVVAGLDNQWRGTFKQWMGCLYMRIKLKNYFSHLWVSGPFQYEFARRLGFNRNKIIFDYYSADVDRFTRESSSYTNAKKFLFVGRLEPVKGIQLLLKAWERIKDKKGWTLTLIGNGSLKSDAIRIKNVTVKDFMQPDDLIKEIRNYSCFILPSTYEPYGVVLHEFTAAGMPIIASDVCGAAPIFVRSGFNGFQFKSNDGSDLKNKIENVINLTDEQLATLGNNSLERARVITPQSSAASLISVLT